MRKGMGMRISANYVAFVVTALLAAPGLATAADRETVLDRKVHIEKDLAREIPDVPRLCDDMKIWKQHLQLPESGNPGGYKLYVEKEGEGIPMVLLHGGPGCTHHVFHPHFSRAARFAQVIYYDQRGCGTSSYTMPAAGYSVDQAADDLDALRSTLNIDRWIVLGHSYGGTLAQCYTAKYPERVAGLVLVSSATYGLPIELRRSREDRFLSKEELQKINEVYNHGDMTMAQLVFNAHLNGDWKRQNFYRPSREDLARMARYEWRHSNAFRSSTCQSLNALDFKGVFDDCPLPVLIMEGKWDLTWNTDKPEKLHSCFPGAKLVLIENSGHSPFADEPKVFFAALQDFVKDLPPVADADLLRWKARIAEEMTRKQQTPQYLLKTLGWGSASSEKIAAKYSQEWLSQLDEPFMFLRAGFALYDVKRYEEALAAFAKMAEFAHGVPLVMSRVWQGHMLDLLGKREEAVAVYQSIADMEDDVTVQHSQYDLTYSAKEYAAERIRTPFVRIENQDKS